MRLSDLARLGGVGPVTLDAGRVELCALFTDLRCARGAEIGVWTGKFSEQLCGTVPGLRLICVDPWQAYDDYHERKNDQRRLDAAYAETTARLARHHCTILRMTSLEAARLTPDASLDFVYIDSNHRFSFVLEDLEAWVPKVRRGGVVAGHDCNTHPKHPHIEVEAAVRHFTTAHAIDPWFILAADKAPSFFWMVQ